jgi:threonylcarbamoyladenosine tRNA methylthiotransferase MtaB
VIVGFPGETEADFQATLNTCRAAGFSKIHSFPFSPRRGTPAAEMPDNVPGDVKAERGHRLAEVENDLRASYYRSLVGRRERVLLEVPSEATSRMVGTSGRYVPVELDCELSRAGPLVDVRIEQSTSAHLLGSVC